MNHPHPDLGLPPKLEAKTLRIVALGSCRSGTQHDRI